MVSRVAQFLVCLLVASAALVSVGAQAGAPGVEATAPSDFDTDNTITRIQLHPNGSATWTLHIRTRLETDEKASEYRAFQDRFRRDRSSYLSPFEERIRSIVGNAEKVTGRQMKADDFEASTSIQPVPRRWGVVTYQFRWTNIAPQQNGQLVLGDVFQGGFFIADGDRLEVAVPSNYQIATADPAPDDRGEGVVSWKGRQSFADARPRIVAEPADSPDSVDGQVGDASLVTGAPLTTPWLAGGALLFVALAMVAVRRWNGSPGVGPFGGDVGSSAGGGGGSGGDVAPESAPGPDTAETAPDSSSPADELLVAEDKVRRLLKRNDGRMRQKAIGEELDWSDSKTSRVLSRMTDDDEVEKLRLGRENVIDLTDDEGGSDSPGR